MADKQKLGIGSVVRLRSGGPAMTIEHDKDECLCVWFVDGRELRSGTFPEASLESAEPEPWPRRTERL
jgi:uncharacterized protein YodC (DUF2158 family)